MLMSILTAQNIIYRPRIYFRQISLNDLSAQAIPNQFLGLNKILEICLGEA